MKKLFLFLLALLTSSYSLAIEHTCNITSGAYEFPNDTLNGSGSISYTFTSKAGTEFFFKSEAYTNGSQAIVVYLDGVEVSYDSPSYYKSFTDNASHTIIVSMRGTPSSMYGKTYVNVSKVVVKHPRENQATSRNITLEDAGDLEFYITKSDKYYINELTLSGPVNGKDMVIIKDMLDLKVGVLSILNMSEVRMVGGGGRCGTHNYEWTGSYGDYDDPTDTYTANDVINDGLFWRSLNLTSIILPKSVSEIRYRAFYGCSNLQTVMMGNSTTKIGNQAFYHCENLSTIKIPESIISIGENAFSGCNSLTKVITSNLASWCMIDFYNKDANPAYYAHTLYTSSSYAPNNLTIPNNCKQIKKFAFAGNTNITSVSFPEGMTSVGDEAFSGCSNLTSITANGGLGNVGFNAFEGCTKVNSVNTNNLAEWCKSSFSINIEEYIVKDSQGNDAHGNDDEDGWYYIEAQRVTGSSNPTTFSKNLKVNGILVSNVSIPEGTYKIGSAAFYNCSNIKSISIPTSIKSIGKMAFEGCSYLTTCNITDISSWNDIQFETFCLSRANCTLSVDVVIGGQTYYNATYSNIYYYTSNPSLLSGNLYSNGNPITNAVFGHSTTNINTPFQYCKNQIVSVSIPNNVTSINNNAFNGCSNLSIVRIDIAAPLSIASTTFSNRNNATLYVPYGSKTAYEAADYWKEFKRIIGFIDGDVNGDGESDVVDVVDIARYVVGTPAEAFVPILADINSSGEVNIADAVCLVNEIAGDQNFAKPMMAPRKAETSEDVLTLTEGENGLSLALENQRDYTAFQFDLYVPEDVDVAQMQLNAQRKQKHQLLYNKVEDGHWRVAALSTSNRTFNGNDGELLSVVYDGIMNDEVSIRNIHFFTADGSDYQFDDISLSGTTAIHSLNNGQGTNVGSSTIYDMQGRIIMSGDSSNRQLPKGLYIINGKKVVIK